MRIAVIGVGGLGCPAALALAQTGFDLRLIDEDRVELSNLHRQVLFGENDVGEYKVVAARRALSRFAPDVEVDAVAQALGPETAQTLLNGVDMVVEGTDSLGAKFLTADVCAALGVSVVHGACVAWMGTVLATRWGHGACYRCVFEAPPTDEELGDCSTRGVYGPVTSVVGALMAAAAVRLARGDRDTPGTLSRYDAWHSRFRATRIAQRPGCPLCTPEPVK